MEDWWENWFFDHLDMNGDNFFNQCQTNSFLNIEEQQPRLSCVTETLTQTDQYPLYFSSSNVVCWGVPSLKQGQYSSSSCSSHHHHVSLEKEKRSFEVPTNMRATTSRGTKRGRSSWETQEDHIMSERKRRQEIAERFVALSAIIPGLKKIDKASVLREAINYVKQLQERIAVLEQETSKRKSITTSIISIRKSHSQSHPSRETNSNVNYLGSNRALPEIEAIGRETEKELLIRIHCEKQNGILLKLLALLENMHLTIASSSVLPFGENTLNITIIAQMGKEYSMTEEELVKSLRQGLMKLYDMQP